MRLLNEDFFDDIDINSDVQTEDIRDDLHYEYDIALYAPILFLSAFKTDIERVKKTYIPKLLYLLENSIIVDSYTINFFGYMTKDTVYPTESLKTVTDINKKIDDVYNQKHQCHFYITLKVNNKITLNRYYDFMKSIIDLVYKYMSKICDPNVSVMFPDTTSIFMVSGNDDPMILSMFIGTTYELLTKTDVDDDAKENIHITTRPRLKYNGPSKLSPESDKQLDDFVLGDMLYYKDNVGLVSQETKHPVAMYLCEIEDEYVFMSLNFMDYTNPEHGSFVPVEMNCGWGKFDYDKIPQTYEEMLDFINNCGCYAEQNWNKGPLKNNVIKKIHKLLVAPLVNCVYRFHPYGTNKGDWCLLTKDEFIDSLNLHDNIHSIVKLNIARQRNKCYSLNQSDFSTLSFGDINKTTQIPQAMMFYSNNPILSDNNTQASVAFLKLKK